MKNLLPHLVQIQLELWIRDAVEGQVEENDNDTIYSATNVSLTYSLDFNELRDRFTSFRM